VFGCMCPCVAVCVCYRQLSTALMPLNSTVASAFNLRLNFQFAFTLFCRLRHKNPKPNRIVTRQWQLLSMCVCVCVCVSPNRLCPLWSMGMPSAYRFLFPTAPQQITLKPPLCIVFHVGISFCWYFTCLLFSCIFFFRLQVEQTKILMHAGSFASDLCT